MRFSTLLDSMTRNDGLFSLVVTDDWGQGRSIYGGTQAALAVRAMRSVVPREIPLRVVQVTFVGPVAPGPVSLRPRVLRQGKNVTHVEARLEVDGSTAAIVIGVFGAARPSRVEVVPRPRTFAGPAMTPIETHYVPGVMPAFVQHFSARYLHGGLPFSASKTTDVLFEAAFHDEGPTLDEHVVALADLPAPVALTMLDSFSYGSSVTWTLELLRDRLADLPLAGWKLDCELTAAHDGYTSQSVMLWGPGGVPVALSRQSMVIFG